MENMRNPMVFLMFVLVALATGCASEAENTSNNQTDRVSLDLIVEFEQDVVYPTSVLSFRLLGTERIVAQAAEVTFTGRSGTGADVDIVTFVDEPGREGDQGNIIVEVPVDAQVWAEIDPSPNAVFIGTISIRLTDEIGVLAQGSLGDQELQFQSDVTPNVGNVASGLYFVNQHIGVTGENFVRPEEGTTWAIVTGTLTYTDTTLGERDLTNEKVALIFDDRQNAFFPIDAGVFGVQLADFTGSLTFETELRNGQKFAGNSQAAFDVTLQESFLGSITPDAGSRGQKITMNGRGFIPTSDEGGYGMLLEFNGELAYDRGGALDLTGENVIVRAPDRVLDEERAEMAVWYEIQDLELYGLGAEPGVFSGTITPVLFDQYGEQTGLPVPTTFRILPDKQVVFLKYLPAFSKALEKYGIQNVEFEVRRRIKEVVNRDYEGVHVEFVDVQPTEFLDYATIEIGGPDPTGGNKFGYDNTCNVQSQKCKDTDNVFLGDYLGGVNANSADQFDTPYGGVFIESFDYFSKRLTPENEDASEEFDRILGPFMPALDGKPVRGTEWPSGPRADQIQEAVNMVGSVVGNTVSHEIGHSLGLAFYPADRVRPGEAFHNRLPGDNAIMDSGGERPFEERAEINGLGPAKFNQRNMDYLLEILPEP